MAKRSKKPRWKSRERAAKHRAMIRSSRIESAIALVDRERELDLIHDSKKPNSVRGASVVTRGMPAPARGSVVDMPIGQWQVLEPMPADHWSEGRQADHVKHVKRASAATQAANELLEKARLARQAKNLADSMESVKNANK